jgi:hypothetical protein
MSSDQAHILGELPGVADWRGPELKASGGWLRSFDAVHLNEIDAALAGLAEKNIAGCDFSQEDFTLPEFSRVIADVLEELENGIGLLSFRGFPVEKYSENQLRQIFWGIGLYFGEARQMNAGGTTLGDVRDEADKDISALEHRRGYKNNGWLNWHSDPADLVVLFCLGRAETGGESRIVSSLALHNEIARTRPDLLEALYQPMPWSWNGRQKQGQNPYCDFPVFGSEHNKLASIYSRQRYMQLSESDKTPPLNSLQKEALDYLAKLADDERFRLTINVQPGDLQLFNSYVTYHSRTAFEDSEQSGNVRHLLRLWLSVKNSRQLPTSFKVVMKDYRAGALRGGYATPD